MNIHEHGIEIRRKFISMPIIDAIKHEVSVSSEMHAKHGIRNADKKFQTINTFSKSAALTNLAESVLGQSPLLVRAIFFDKTPDKNWLVTWHQDKAIRLIPPH